MSRKKQTIPRIFIDKPKVRVGVRVRRAGGLAGVRAGCLVLVLVVVCACRLREPRYYYAFFLPTFPFTSPIGYLAKRCQLPFCTALMDADDAPLRQCQDLLLPRIS